MNQVNADLNMRLGSSFLAIPLYAYLGLSQTITVAIDPEDSDKCVFKAEGLEGCGTIEDPAYSTDFGPLRNGKDCSARLGGVSDKVPYLYHLSGN